MVIRLIYPAKPNKQKRWVRGNEEEEGRGRTKVLYHVNELLRLVIHQKELQVWREVNIMVTNRYLVLITKTKKKISRENFLETVEEGWNLPIKPLLGVAISGGAISNVTPQTTVVLPNLIKDDDGAVEIDPVDYILEKRKWFSLFSVQISRRICRSSRTSRIRRHRKNVLKWLNQIRLFPQRIPFK